LFFQAGKQNELPDAAEVQLMLSTKTACKMAGALDGVTLKDHFGSDAYCANKRIFATVWHEKNEVNLRLSVEQQRRSAALKRKSPKRQGEQNESMVWKDRFHSGLLFYRIFS
jgi:hypothetical protein